MDNKGVGLDIGTNMLVSAAMDESGNPVYKRQRDAFFKISPKNSADLITTLPYCRAEAGDYVFRITIKSLLHNKNCFLSNTVPGTAPTSVY